MVNVEADHAINITLVEDDKDSNNNNNASVVFFFKGGMFYE